MSVAGPLITLVGTGALIWAGWRILEKKAKERRYQPPRGRSTNNTTSSVTGGTGYMPRSSSVKTVNNSKSNSNRKVVRHKEKPYWKRRGWKKKDEDLIGYYRTKYGTFKGKIKDYRTNPEAFIYNPPKQLNNHDHSSCFIPRKKGAYFIHFKRGANNPSLAIQNVERILRESFKAS